MWGWIISSIVSAAVSIYNTDQQKQLAQEQERNAQTRADAQSREQQKQLEQQRLLDNLAASNEAQADLDTPTFSMDSSEDALAIGRNRTSKGRTVQSAPSALRVG